MCSITRSSHGISSFRKLNPLRITCISFVSSDSCLAFCKKVDRKGTNALIASQYSCPYDNIKKLYKKHRMKQSLPM